MFEENQKIHNLSVLLLLLMAEIPDNHLTCMKPCKSWDKLPTSTGAGFQPSTVSHFFFDDFFPAKPYPNHTPKAEWFAGFKGDEILPSFIGIIWVVPLPSNSHHQDHYIFSRESRTKPSFATVTGRGDNPRNYSKDPVMNHYEPRLL